jgi:hypothetical protein
VRAVVGSHDREIVTGLREVEDGTDFAVTSRRWWPRAIAGGAARLRHVQKATHDHVVAALDKLVR